MLSQKPLAGIPEGVTHVFTRQHKAVGLQTPWEGPFKIASRPSRSTVQIKVGNYKNGEKRYEVRHFNDLKLAHPDSLAAPAVRPALGRPAKTSAPLKSPSSTDAVPLRTPPNRFPNPPPSSSRDMTNQTGINKEGSRVADHPPDPSGRRGTQNQTTSTPSG